MSRSRFSQFQYFQWIVALLLLGCPSQSAEPLRAIAPIRALSPKEAARPWPVDLEAVVTFRDPAQSALIADDGQEGIYVTLPKDASAALRTGCRIRLQGVTEPGGFLPIIHAQQVALLGVGSRPEPRPIQAADLFSPSIDCQWVSLPAIITGIEDGPGWVLIAEVSGWTVKILLPRSAEAPERTAQLMQQPVTLHGVVGSVFNEHRQLTGRHFFVSSFDDIVPAEGSEPTGESPLRALHQLLQSDATARTRVRVQGVVTHAASEGLYLRGNGGSIFVRAANPREFTEGTRVEAEGFAAVAPFRPILRASRVTALERGGPPPVPLAFSNTDIALQQAELVVLEADFLGRRPGPGGGTVLHCRATPWFFEALLPEGAALTADFDEQDRVRLTGICELTTTRTLPFSVNADGFRLHLRTAADVVVLRHAPWWTLRRLLWALAAVGVLALVALAWVALLRQRVTEQTRIIGVQIERAAVKDERQRIARELHDTIEQELAGLSIQLRNARQRLTTAPHQAGTALELAERMLRHCRSETRTSIRDLRSVALEQRGLAGALEELLSPLAAECGASFAVEVVGSPGPLAGPSELHLLRIAQEAVANAARHAAPREIRVFLEYRADGAVVLEIRDNGCGFNPEAPAPRGHFGLLGIRERVNKLQAAYTLESAPGTGTRLELVLPAGSAIRLTALPS